MSKSRTLTSTHNIDQNRDSTNPSRFEALVLRSILVITF